MKTVLHAVLAFVLCVSSASGMDTLDRPVTLTVPFPAGSAMDVRARIVSKYAKDILGQNIIVDNKPGAAGLVGVTGFVTQKTRNYSVLFCGSSVFTAVPLFNKALYSIDSIVPLVSVDVELFGMFACPEQTGIRTLDDLKNYRERVKYATGAPGSIGHIACASTMNLLKLDADHIVTNGASVNLTECLGGHNTIAFAGLGLAKGFVEEGRLVPLFSFGSEDYTGYEGVVMPSLKTLGVDFSCENLTFFSMPKGTDAEVAACVTKALEQVMANPACVAELKAAGAEDIRVLSGGAILDVLNAEYNVIRENGIAIGLTPVK